MPRASANPYRQPWHSSYFIAPIRAVTEALEHHTLEIFTLDTEDFVYDEFGNVRRPAYRPNEPVQ